MVEEEDLGSKMERDRNSTSVNRSVAHITITPEKHRKKRLFDFTATQPKAGKNWRRYDPERRKHIE